MKHNAQIEVVERVNKNGEPYQMLNVYMQVKDEYILIHEIYMRDALQQIVTALSKLNATK